MHIYVSKNIALCPFFVFKIVENLQCMLKQNCYSFIYAKRRFWIKLMIEKESLNFLARFYSHLWIRLSHFGKILLIESAVRRILNLTTFWQILLGIDFWVNISRSNFNDTFADISSVNIPVFLKKKDIFCKILLFKFHQKRWEHFLNLEIDEWH